MSLESGCWRLSGQLLDILRCPLCKARLLHAGGKLQCKACARIYPIVLGIPDLRIYEDPLIPLEDDYRKGHIVQEQAEKLTFAELVRFYWSLPTYPYTPPDLKERFVSQVLSHEERIEESYAGELPGGGSFLDVGCGTAALVKVMQQKYGFAVGCDVAFRWLLIARKRLEEAALPVNLVCCCADYLPFPDGEFDSVASISLLEHLPEPEPAIREFHRVTATGSPIFLYTSNRFCPGPEPHVRVWGVGFLPRRWMGAYVRFVKGVEYKKKYQLSIFEVNRFLRRSGLRQRRFLLPAVTKADWNQLRGIERLGAHLYSWLSGIRLFRRPMLAISPVIQVIATGDEEHGTTSHAKMTAAARV